MDDKKNELDEPIEAQVENQRKNKVKNNVQRRSVLDFRKYTKQIWLAGLGAFSRAEEEGNKLFDSLVKVGEELESKTTDLAEHTVERVAVKTKEQVIDTKDKIERILDQSVHLSLSRIGLVTPKDIQHLEKMIIQLHQKVDHLAEENQKLRQELKK
jgi:poly(hydroxyalkanoate) granule-associated protein